MKNNARISRWAVVKRRRLVERLGGVCAFCGTKENLEIDHMFPRGYDPAKLSSHMRVIRYYREAEAGLLRVLCRSCNARRGEP